MYIVHICRVCMHVRMHACMYTYIHTYIILSVTHNITAIHVADKNEPYMRMGHKHYRTCRSPIELCGSTLICARPEGPWTASFCMHSHTKGTSASSTSSVLNYWHMPAACGFVSESMIPPCFCGAKWSLNHSSMATSCNQKHDVWKATNVEYERCAHGFCSAAVAVRVAKSCSIEIVVGYYRYISALITRMRRLIIDS
jgi:hypothetical protein